MLALVYALTYPCPSLPADRLEDIDIRKLGELERGMEQAEAQINGTRLDERYNTLIKVRGGTVEASRHCHI